MAVHTSGLSRRLRVIIGTAVVLLLAAIAVPVVRALSTRADRPVAGTSVSPSGSAVGVSPSGSAVGVSPSGSAKPAYTATFTGDADGSHWTGTESVTFSNPGPAAMAQVWLRTWGNGPHGCGQVAVRVTAVEGGAVGDPTVGCTALPITLAPALGARKQATISFAVSIAVPPDRSRFGVAGGYANLGNALPLLAVPGDQGRPLPPYTGLGESFYSVTSDFTVTLTHPTALAVPATGEVTAETTTGATTTTRIHASDVRDFAWAAGAYRVQSDRSRDGVRINTWVTPADRDEDVRTTVDVARRAVEGYSSAYGKYPWPELDVVLADSGGGGMEYPTFVLAEPADLPVAHEVAHQWWYSLVGNDEYAHPWLDESVATYATARLLSTRADCAPTFPSSTARIDAGMDYFDAHPKEYGTVVYGLGGCMLADLEKALGADTMTTFLREYATTYRFGVATPKDFRTAAQAHTGIDLTPLWQRWRNTRD